jgi:TolB-like protein
MEVNRVLDGFHPGQVVGRFEIVREIGRGGFGVVYEAKDVELGRTVALKAVLPTAAPNVREDRLLREAEAAARLSHPNIVTVHDVGRCDAGPYLVLELLHGQNLARRLDQGALPLREALRIAVKVAKGLAHAHAEGVVHRDLTPGNVFLCDDGQVKVLDFGMAHAFGRRKLDGGTRYYMAPEQLAGAPEDERTDVFALGVVLYQMLSGELPPAGRRGVLLGSSEAPRLEVLGYPALGRLLRRMLDEDAVKRPRDARELLGALIAFQEELARSPAAAIRVQARAARVPTRPIAMLLLAAFLVAVGSSAGWRALTRRRATSAIAVTRGALAPKLSVAVLPFADMSPRKDQQYLADGIAEEILNRLALVEGLRVVPRTSSFSYKGRSLRIPEIARELKSEAVLEGSVRKDGQRVRITAKLLEIDEDGCPRVRWSESYDRELTGVFALENEIAASTVAALTEKLAQGAAGPRAHGPAGSQRQLSRPIAAPEKGLRSSVKD